MEFSQNLDLIECKSVYE